MALPKLASMIIDEKWIKFLAKEAQKVEVPHEDLHIAEYYRLAGRIRAYGLKGSMPEHTDDDFPEWAYILILRADNNPLFRCAGHRGITLKAGMIVEFNAHIMHSLKQNKNSTLVWIGLDSHEKISLERAIKCHKILWDEALAA